MSPLFAEYFNMKECTISTIIMKKDGYLYLLGWSVYLWYFILWSLVAFLGLIREYYPLFRDSGFWGTVSSGKYFQLFLSTLIFGAFFFLDLLYSFTRFRRYKNETKYYNWDKILIAAWVSGQIMGILLYVFLLYKVFPVSFIQISILVFYIGSVFLVMKHRAIQSEIEVDKFELKNPEQIIREKVNILN